MVADLSHQLFTDLIQQSEKEPTADQRSALHGLSNYCLSKNPDTCFILSGYAGTGKTTLIKTLVKTLPKFKLRTVLLAPTGRAAKVMSSYSKKMASTIHRHIYVPKSRSQGLSGFGLKRNMAHSTIYLVDEASMIGDYNSSRDQQSLLADMLRFVSSGTDCKLIFIGDIAQLPPVGLSDSPALNPEYLRQHYDKDSSRAELTEVMRQASDSSILTNATRLRENLLDKVFKRPKFRQSPEFISLSDGYEIEEALNDSYNQVGREDTIVIVRSNKRAFLYNQQIRSRILWQEDEISAGDFLMVVKNNYFWLPEGAQANFIANGDTLEVLSIREKVELYGFNFAKLNVRMVDYPGQAAFDVMVHLKVLDLEGASLSSEDTNNLYHSVLEDYQHIPQKYKQMLKVKSNEYFNALQVKFAYAVTCHKSQGGQWRRVFVERPWYPQDDLTEDDLRWLYTAFTRAQEKLYLIGFGEEFLEDT